jgi:hypothetical protein
MRARVWGGSEGFERRVVIAVAGRPEGLVKVEFRDTLRECE